MEENQVVEKTCKNCKYYKQHYIWADKRLRTVQGHCVQNTVMRRYRFSIDKLCGQCPYWEQTEDTPEKQRESIEKIIRQMNDRLEILVQLLTVDDE